MRTAIVIAVLCLLTSAAGAAIMPMATGFDDSNFPLVDDCNRVENPLSNGGKWTTRMDPGDTSQWMANGTVCTRAATPGGAASTAWNELLGPNMGMSVDVPDAVTAAGNFLRIFVRAVQISPTVASVDGYVCQWRPFEGELHIYRWTNGFGSVALIGLVSKPVVSGDRIACSATGTTIAAWRNTGSGWTLEASVQDSFHPPQGLSQVGMEVSTMGLSFDNIRAGTIHSGFNDQVFNLPNLPYGPEREPCESPQAGDITLSPTGSWEAQLENVANGGRRFFLNEGTYNTTSGNILTLAPGLSVSQPTIVKPNNCADVTIVMNHTGRWQPTSHTVTAGMTFIRVLASTGAGMIDFGTAAGTTGVILRNNHLRADGNVVVNLRTGPTHTDMRIEGNIIIQEDTAPTELSYIQVTSNVVNMLIEHNRFDRFGTPAVQTSGPGLHVIEPWGGDITMYQNFFNGNAGSFYVDGKSPGNGKTGIINVEENFMNGQGIIPARTCILLHGNDPPRGPYTMNIRRNFFDQCNNHAINHFISAGDVTPPFEGATLVAEHNIIIAAPGPGRTIVIDLDNALLVGNTVVGGQVDMDHPDNPNPQNVIFRDNIFSNVDFDLAAPAGLEGCSFNTFHNVTDAPTNCTNSLTSDPLFVDENNDWHLRPGSPSSDSGSEGQDRGAYGLPSQPGQVSSSLFPLPTITISINPALAFEGANVRGQRN